MASLDAESHTAAWGRGVGSCQISLAREREEKTVTTGQGRRVNAEGQAAKMTMALKSQAGPARGLLADLRQL